MKQTKLSYFALLSSLMLTVVACNNAKPADSSSKTESSPSASSSVSESSSSSSSETVSSSIEEYIVQQGDEAIIYENILGEFSELNYAAKAAATDSERFVLYAQAEASLLDSAIMSPYTTQGGAYTISRVAPRTIPYVMYGNDDDRWKGVVISDQFVTTEERAELLAAWETAKSGGAAYDPAAYLQGKGHTINKHYKTTFSTGPATLDTLNTSEQSDTEILVQTIEGLVEHNNLGQLKPRLATSYDVSADGKTYTFHIRTDAKWYKSTGEEYASVTAQDFVDGFHHMLDADSGLDWLVTPVVAGAQEYLDGEATFASVGYKAEGNDLIVTLLDNFTYFPTMLTYSCFMPMCGSFFAEQGGVYGASELKAAKTAGTYHYGDKQNPASMVYNGPFILEKNLDNEIKVVKNANYYDAANVVLDDITWVFDDGQNIQQTYNDAKNGVYAGLSLSAASGTLDWAKNDGLFTPYAYISDTTSTSYLCGLNVDRGTYVLANGNCASVKKDDAAAKEYTFRAMQNKNFRKALQHAFDRAAVNAVTRGDDLKYTNLRNMYTAPGFVQLSEDVTDSDGHKFNAGTSYGDLVQYYCNKIGCKVNCADGQDGWFKPTEAQAYFAAAKAELGLTDAVQIDVVYLSTNKNNTAQAQAYKRVVEETLGVANVKVNLIEASTADDYYACGYRAKTGKAGNFDCFFGSGWGPDFGDPCSYLDTFLGAGQGYMTKICGLF